MRSGSELADIPGLTSQLKGGKKSSFQKEDPLLEEKATLPTGVFAVHVFGCQNLYLDESFPPEHFGMYVHITAGLTSKCTSLQSPLKKGRVVWNEIRNFPVIISSKLASPVNKVTIAVLGYDKLQHIPKHKLLGKTEFHLHKLAKYAGDIQLELAFAYGSYGYGLCEQIESHHPPRYYLQQSSFPHLELPTSLSGNSSGIIFAPKRVPHPSIIPFKQKVVNLEPDLSPYYSETSFVPSTDLRSRPQLQQKMTRLNQLHTDYSQLPTRNKRIDFLKRLLQEKDLQGSMTAGDHESDSDSSCQEDLGDMTQFGLTGALAQMANLTFMTGVPDLVQAGPSTSGAGQSVEDGDKVEQGDASGLSSLLQQVKAGPSTSASCDKVDYEEEDEDKIMASIASRGRRIGVVVNRPSQKKAKPPSPSDAGTSS